MGQILIRNLDDAVLARLKALAEAQKKSMEQTAREVLAAALKPSREDILAEIDAIRAQSRPWRPGEPTAEEIVRAMRDERTERQTEWLSTPASSSNGSSRKKGAPRRGG
jgi:plasmid stability protein